jgi:flagellar protein FlgJ
MYLQKKVSVSSVANQSLRFKKMENQPIHRIVQSPDRSTPASQPGEKKVDREKLKKACADFEALLVARMLKLMRQSIPQNGLLGNGPGKEIYQSLMDQELAKKMSKRGGIGLGEVFYRQVLQREEKARAAAREGPPEARTKVEGSEGR